jgi:hypothetical protein
LVWYVAETESWSVSQNNNTEVRECCSLDCPPHEKNLAQSTPDLSRRRHLHLFYENLGCGWGKYMKKNF